MIRRLFVILSCIAVASVGAATPKKPVKKSARSRTVPGPYPAIIQINAPASATEGIISSTLDGAGLGFLRTASETGQRQLALATLGKDRGDSAEVKAVASAIASTQTAENESIAKLAAQKGVSLNDPTAADPALAALKGPKFDKQWMDALIDVNESSVRAYESGVQSADADIKSFAGKMLPLAKSKLQVASRLAGRPAVEKPAPILPP